MWVGVSAIHRGVDVGCPLVRGAGTQTRDSIPAAERLLSCYLLADVDFVQTGSDKRLVS